MSRVLSTVLDEANPNKNPSALQTVRNGRALRTVTAFREGAVATNVFTLPEDAKAAEIVRAFKRVAGTTGYSVVVAPETAAPAATQVTVAPNGDILFAAADAVTQAEILYQPMEGEIFEDTVSVAASLALFAQSRRGLLLISATIVTGVIPGAKTVVARGTASAAGQAAISIVGTGVLFNAADVVTGVARLRYIAVPGVGNSALASLSGRLLGSVEM